jgi:hypothetical protein
MVRLGRKAEYSQILPGRFDLGTNQMLPQVERLILMVLIDIQQMQPELPK